MKRFLSLLTVFLLAFALAVPVGASSPMVQYGDDFYPMIPVNSSPADYPYSVIIERPYASGSEYYLWFAKSFETVGYEHRVGDRIVYVLDSDSSVWTYEGTDTANRPVAQYYVVRWTNKDIVNVNVPSSPYVAYPAVEPIYPVCDGSSCPANDVNADDICDDCGMMLSLRATAPDYPTLPTVSGAYKHYVLSKASSGRYDYSVFVSDTPFTAQGERGSAYIANFSDTATVYRYSSSNGNDWELNVDGSTGNSFTVGATGYLELVQSTFTWYDESGTPFFPKPLYQTMGEVVAEEMPELSQMTGGTMKTLVVCGVGLMACLMALSLFGKRWLLFLR